MMLSGTLKLRSPAMPGPHNPPTALWMAGAQDFDVVRRRALIWRFFERIFLRAKPLPLLEEFTRQRHIHHRTDLGLHVVAIKAIVGSVGRSDDFDRFFRPLHRHMLDRWVSIHRSHWLGMSLPPVELIEVDGRYFVSDGHHRVSVARWHGQAFLEARVVRLEMHAARQPQQPEDAP